MKRVSTLSFRCPGFLLLLISQYFGVAQCTSGYASGDLNISGICTISSDITITGNLNLNSGANLTISSGITVTVNGYLSTGYNAGTVYLSGGTLDVGSFLRNEDQTNWYIDNTTINTTTYFLNDYEADMYVCNSVVNIGSYLHNDDRGILEFDNSTVIADGYFFNDYQSDFLLENGSDMTINGNTTINGYALHNEDQTDFIVDNSSLTINGDVWNDYQGNMEVNNGGSMEVDGSFRNEDQATLSLTDGSLSISGDFINDYQADVNVNDGGQMLVEGDVMGDPTSTIDVAEGGGFCASGDPANDGNVVSDGGDTDCSDGCCGETVTLPVELVSFEVKIGDQNQVSLTWKTASEQDNDHFTIEKSYNGHSYLKAGEVLANGTTSFVSSYDWQDKSPLRELVYYRLSQTDFDGTSKIIALKAVSPKSGISSFSFYPNPVSMGESIFVGGFIPDQISLYDQNGQLIHDLQPLDTRVALPILLPGVYIIKFESKERTITKKLMVR